MNYEEVKIGTYYFAKKYSYSDELVVVKCLRKLNGQVLIRKSRIDDTFGIDKPELVSPNKLFAVYDSGPAHYYKKIRMFYFAITLLAIVLFLCGVFTFVMGLELISFLAAEWFFIEGDKQYVS